MKGEHESLGARLRSCEIHVLPRLEPRRACRTAHARVLTAVDVLEFQAVDANASFTVTFWLPNVPEVQGEVVAAFGAAGRVGEELFELVRLSPAYPDGLTGPTVRLDATFTPVRTAAFAITFDRLFHGAFSPWPAGR
jgi:hypothetical protein